MSFIDKLKGMFGPKHAHHPHEHTREDCDCEHDPEAKDENCCGAKEEKGDCCGGHDHA